MGRSNYRNLLKTSRVKCTWPQHTVWRNRTKTKHRNGILQLSRRKVGIARGDAASGKTQRISENLGWELGKIQELSYCHGHSAPHTQLEQLTWFSEERSPNTSTDPATEWIPESLRWENSPRPSSPTFGPSSPPQTEQSIETMCSHGELTAPLVVSFHFLEYWINLLLESFLEGKNHNKQKGFMP